MMTTRLGLAGLTAAMILAPLLAQAQQDQTRQIASVQSSGGDLPELMGSIAQWIASHSRLEVPPVLPAVRFVPKEDLATLRLGMLGPGGSADAQLPLAPGGGDVLAFYDAEGSTIYLGSDWTGGTPAELSILVHEMVHHVSAEQQRRNRVLDDEILAFQLQDVWLRESGETLEDTFGIDPFTLTMMTQWTY